MHPDFQLFDPMRAPSWRYHRVMTLWRGGEQPRFPTRWDDRYVRTYLHFLREYRSAEARGEVEVAASGRGLDDSPSIMELFGRKAHLWYAHQLHTDPDGELRALVQARILARESDDQIALRFQTLPAAIDWYEKLFFHVRDRLDCRDWIVKSILGTWLTRQAGLDGTQTESQRDLIYKIFAYHGGTHVLDALICALGPQPAPGRAADTEAWLESGLKHMVKVKATAALQILATDKFNAIQLVELGLRVLRTDASAGNNEQRGSALESAVADLVDGLPQELAGRQDKALTPL